MSYVKTAVCLDCKKSRQMNLVPLCSKHHFKYEPLSDKISRMSTINQIVMSGIIRAYLEDRWAVHYEN